jgi:hypothetical protein
MPVDDQTGDVAVGIAAAAFVCATYVLFAP